VRSEKVVEQRASKKISKCFAQLVLPVVFSRGPTINSPVHKYKGKANYTWVHNNVIKPTGPFSALSKNKQKQHDEEVFTRM